jgi:hypothetical protein
VLNLLKDEGEISSYEAKALDVIVSFLWVERVTIKEPAVPDIEWHSRLFVIAGVMSYTRAVASHI